MATKLVFDIGAYIGKWTLENMDESTKFICVEPNPVVFSKLKRNYGNYSNVECIQAAVTNLNDKYTSFYASSMDTLSTLNKEWLTASRSRFHTSMQTINEIIVPTVTLDSLIETYGVPDLIKIGVEGAEENAIYSLTKKVPCVCFQWAAEWREENKRCIDALVKLGFTKFNLQYDDKYTYRPMFYNYTAEKLKSVLDMAVDKDHWGMIWAV